MTLVYGWFTEGFGTADGKDAKALLDELAEEIPCEACSTARPSQTDHTRD